MDASITHTAPTRPRWAIEDRLERLVGGNVRVAAEAFAPVRWNGEPAPGFIPVRSLILPDNSQPAGTPVFFEGRLMRFERRVGAVFVTLAAPALPDPAAEGAQAFRGGSAVPLHGPATVQLAFPFRVEPLLAAPVNYWADRRVPGAQFRLPGLADDAADGASPPVCVTPANMV
jgi:hypothetical protein